MAQDSASDFQVTMLERNILFLSISVELQLKFFGFETIPANK